jgi:membrane-bound lytic murein transglycosylase D
MPATAKSFGLSRWPFDQRKQAEPAAQAAAKYLRQLHEKFGDWRLAVAAYNSGAGTVERCLRRRHATSYAGIATSLPAETQMYVPKVETTILKREGLELEQLKTPPAIAHPSVPTE